MMISRTPLRVSYSKTEIVDHVDKLEHGIVRELLKAMDSTSRVRPEPSECENGIGTCSRAIGYVDSFEKQIKDSPISVLGVHGWETHQEESSHNQSGSPTLTLPQDQ